MLQDETIKNYVSWRKHESLDALYIPDIEAFAVNVMPKYFKEMKGGWGSFQKQLNNYGFEKRDRGAGKALYTHSGNNFRKGRPDLLPKVLRRLCPKPTASAGRGSRPAQEPPTAPIEPTTPQSDSQTDPRAKEDQLEHEKKKLEREILELKRKLELSEARRSEAENQFQTTENRLQATENLLLEMGNQLIALLSTVNVPYAGPSSYGGNHHLVPRPASSLSSKSSVPGLHDRIGDIKPGLPFVYEKDHKWAENPELASAD
ncbi:hypothetical protein FRC04_005934 [Tulasnella sp. 424]|nr:hypothetical protein FRC04_005934 [Tulasnella sp. 424]